MHRNRRWRISLSIALALWATLAPSGCRSEHAQFTTLAESLIRSIRSNDANAFVKLHVQPGDTSPSGAFWLATRAGGSRPNDAWNEEIRAAFRELDRGLEQERVRTESLELVEIAHVTTFQVDGDSDRLNLSDLSLRVTDEQNEYLLTFAEGMLARRGWVISGDASVTLTRQSGKGR